jgi:hypothetical protein
MGSQGDCALRGPTHVRVALTVSFVSMPKLTRGAG